jgi:hypothetical protein
VGLLVEFELLLRKAFWQLMEMRVGFVGQVENRNTGSRLSASKSKGKTDTSGSSRDDYGSPFKGEKVKD